MVSGPIKKSAIFFIILLNFLNQYVYNDKKQPIQNSKPMKTKLFGIEIPNGTIGAVTATFIKDGKMQTIPIPLTKIEVYLRKRKYTYNISQHDDCKIYYNLQKSNMVGEHEELIGKILNGNDGARWVVSEIFTPCVE